MSRIGRLPVAIPAGVDVKFDGSTVTVKGPKGTLTKALIQAFQSSWKTVRFWLQDQMIIRKIDPCMVLQGHLFPTWLQV